MTAPETTGGESTMMQFWDVCHYPQGTTHSDHTWRMESIDFFLFFFFCYGTGIPYAKIPIPPGIDS